MKRNNIAIWHIIPNKYRVYAHISIPKLGDTDIQVFTDEGNGKFLVTLPDFCWSSYVCLFDKFTSSQGAKNLLYEGFRGYVHTMGDVKIPIPEVQQYVIELKYIFSMLLSILYNRVNDEKYLDKDTTVEGHIRYCKDMLTDCGVHIARFPDLYEYNRGTGKRV
ncbi:hypothetical protein [Bacillus thuringiensis]|uniref:Uncharacterized protein n=1 Tax=Bacillus thuringiensis Bt18247 TaxID=1423143 RepID=A0A9W3XCC7_BACTU|nr:hypothetical protein [Bacillus thuringiensis]AOM14613.1 hypothetical protein BTI247_62830 [Bacillus thuringiensis Bt18247]MBG9524230.1 hypothetical protein [Bacillus thuringiensis]